MRDNLKLATGELEVSVDQSRIRAQKRLEKALCAGP